MPLTHGIEAAREIAAVIRERDGGFTGTPTVFDRCLFDA